MSDSNAPETSALNKTLGGWQVMFYGLGSMLHDGRELLRMEQVVGVMGVVMLVGLLADLALFGPAERWLRRSRGLSA